MATTSEARALPFFTDLNGQPLSSGFIYIGQPGLDPVAYPAVVTSDIAGTTVVAQPIRTTNGHAAAAGSLIHLFCAVPYSITILDSAGRLVYASLNETDPVAVAIGSSTVQSSYSLADLRARSRSSTNQVWVTGYGMYVYQPADNTSPENIPLVIVGYDGARYYLDTQSVNATWVKVSGVSANPTLQGAWYSWDDEGQGIANVTNNVGLGSGGFVFRSVNAGNTAELGRVTFNGDGSIASKSILATGDVRATNNLAANNGIVGLNATGTRTLTYDGVADAYNLTGAQLNINGSQAVNDGNLAAKSSPVIATIMRTSAVGGLTLTTGAAPSSPGTWFAIAAGVGSTGITLWVRTA